MAKKKRTIFSGMFASKNVCVVGVFVKMQQQTEHNTSPLAQRLPGTCCGCVSQHSSKKNAVKKEGRYKNNHRHRLF